MLIPLTKLKVKLDEDIRQCWRWSSMRFLALGGVVQGAVVTCPAAISDHLPSWVMSAASSFSFFCIIAAGVGRITKVDNAKPSQPDQ